MSTPSEPESWEQRREKIIGLGERSMRRSYYPQLRDRLAELETKNATLCAEIERRRRADADLEQRVAELSTLNRALAAEIGERTRVEAERLRLEEQVLGMQKMEAVGRLAGGIAHDFNNILTSIFGHSELSLARLEPQLPPRDPALERLRQVQRDAERAAALTRQLLAFGRRQVLRPQYISLNAVVRDLEKMLRRLVAENVHLALVLGPAVGTIYADQGQVEQVLMNLVVNARDAMPQGGTLTIETREIQRSTDAGPQDAQGPYALLIVRDTGCGISPEVHAHIWEPFFTTKAPNMGTGLGLATIHGIVHQAGGHVAVDGNPGRGAEFRIYFPLAARAPSAPAAADQAASAPTGRETILLCEDDPAVRELTTQMLASAGYNVLVAGNGAAALELARQAGSVELLITDVVMPDMSGFKLAEALATYRPGVPSLFVSGYAADVIAQHGELARGAEFLEKPYHRLALLRKVRQALDTPRGASLHP